MDLKEAFLEFAGLIGSEVEDAVGRSLAGRHTPSDSGGLLSNEEAMRVLGVSRATLQRYRSSGKIPYVVVGGRARYNRQDVESLLNPQTTTTND